jgi:hypothetical protein
MEWNRLIYGTTLSNSQVIKFSDKFDLFCQSVHSTNYSYKLCNLKVVGESELERCHFSPHFDNSGVYSLRDLTGLMLTFHNNLKSCFIQWAFQCSLSYNTAIFLSRRYDCPQETRNPKWEETYWKILMKHIS